MLEERELSCVRVWVSKVSELCECVHAFDTRPPKLVTFPAVGAFGLSCLSGAFALAAARECPRGDTPGPERASYVTSNSTQDSELAQTSGTLRPHKRETMQHYTRNRQMYKWTHASLMLGWESKSRVKRLALPMRVMVPTANGEVVLAPQHEKRRPTDLGPGIPSLFGDPGGCWVSKFSNLDPRSAVAPLERIQHG